MFSFLSFYLLFLGLASSVLEVKAGDKYWQNERIWLSLAKINAGKVDHVTNSTLDSLQLFITVLNFLFKNRT